jgi:hypothetical protein
VTTINREPAELAERRRRKDCDRDRAIEPRIERPVNLAHPAGADRRDDFVRPEANAGREGH